MSRDEYRLVFGGSAGIPFQEMLGADWRAVLVHAKDREVEVVTRIGKVVRVAAEEGHLLLGREHQPDVGVLLVTVEPILCALVERHDVGPQAGSIEAFFLDLCNLSLACLECRLRRGRSTRRGHDSRRDVFGRHQHVQLEVGRFHFLRSGTRVEPVGHVILLRRRQLLQLSDGDMIIRQHEAVG